MHHTARLARAWTLELALSACLLASCAAAEEKKTTAAHLAVFDDLDFRVFSGQQWQDLHKSHAGNVKVHWPDGRVSEGLDQHIHDLQSMFVYAPDTRIKMHPVKFGAGEWTSVIGLVEGTFTEPMQGPRGKLIPPTGRPFVLWMATVSHWKDGVMDEEYLFWDNASYASQLGL